VGAVVMTPDTPLLFFWTACLAALARLLRTSNPAWWLAAGIAGGLALDSKYTACLLGLSIGLWLVALPDARRWLRCWQVWAGLALALLIFAPVLGWNAAHHWASFARQGGRTGAWRPAEAVRFLGELLGSQIGLDTPGIFALFAAGMVGVARGAWRGRAPEALLACVTLLPAIVFVQHALGDRVQANWPAVIAPGAALASAAMAARYWRPACALGLAMTLAVYVQAAAAPLALPRAWDFTLIRLAGWQDLAGAVFVAQGGAGADFVAADEYGLAAELAFRLRGEVVGVEPRWSFFGLPKASLAGRRGILVRSNREWGPPDPALWSDIVQLGTTERARHGIVAETYRLYAVRWRGGGRIVPVVLPRGAAVKLNGLERP
jgi:4-amino-4-deoxy-L-arabinose transferase-like glycosyltransferase